MNVIYSKQAIKTLGGMDMPTKQRIRTAIELLPEGDTKQIEGRKLIFHVAAHDSQGIIGEGIHERAIVDIERFMGKICPLHNSLSKPCTTTEAQAQPKTAGI